MTDPKPQNPIPSGMRAYRSMLWFILNFCTTNDNQSYKSAGHHGFTSCFGETQPQIGDLVIPTATPITQWTLSWLLDISDTRKTYTPDYLLQSVETGEICNWSNVGIKYFDRTVLRKHPEWTWSDRQFAFNDRWKKTCYKKHKANFYIPAMPKFGPEHQVTLGVLTKLSYHGRQKTRTFEDWRKVTINIMSETFLALEEAAKNDPDI